METTLAKIIDECLSRINSGETIEACLAQYAHVREQIEPLLRIALSVSAAPKAAPSDEFVKGLAKRLMKEYQEERVTVKAPRVSHNEAYPTRLGLAWQNLLGAFTGARRVAIPAMLALILMIAASLGAFNFLSPSPALASQCTLSIFSGDVEILKPGSNNWQDGADGMTLEAGARVRTSPSSHALLTFFEGSTVKLEPATDVEIKQLDYDDEQATTIVLKQWMGKTWSRVVKMADPGSHYEIETPSAYAIVRGTLFSTEVNETGATRVATTEGLVTVVAQDEEVYLPANQQTQVEAGLAPSPPITAAGPDAEIVINVDMPAVASVIDPTGASTGFLPTGLSFNQIPGSQSSSLAGGTQVITIPQPVSGEYIVTLRYVTEGKARFNIQGKTEGEAAFGYTGTYEGLSEGGWLIRINVHIEDGQIASSYISGIESIGGEVPEKIIEAKPGKEGLEPVRSLTEDKAQGAGKVEDSAQNSDKNEDKAQGSDKDEDSAQGRDKNEDKAQGRDKDEERFIKTGG